MPLTMIAINNTDFKALVKFFPEELIRNAGLVPKNEVILSVNEKLKMETA